MDANDILSTAIEQWHAKLLRYIESSLLEHKKVVVIALSRKMPRVLGLIENHFLSSDEQSMSFLERCEVTTEHAIPFVLHQGENQEVIILDDIMNTGDTVQTVVNDVNEFTGNEPTVFSLIQSEAVKSIEGARSCISGREVSKEQLADCFELITKKILEKGLPIDMEYPILCLDSQTYSNIYNQLPDKLRSAYPQSIQYRVSHKISDNYVLILEEETNKLYNNDFAKLRFYENEGTIKVVSFSANVLSEYNLRQESMFENLVYDRLWKVVWDEACRKRMKEDKWQAQSSRVYRTLVVWANYLHSLSSFNRNKKNFSSVTGDEFQVLLKDLILILGNSLAKKILPEVNDILRKGEISPSTREFLKVPTCLVNERISKAYDFYKFTICRKSDTVDSALHEIFMMGGVLQKKAEQLTPPLDDDMPIQESFVSLVSSLRKGFGFMSLSPEEIYHWIDQKIDEGRVVPRYERVKDEDGNAYWKRYFKYSPLVLGQD
jgi:hypoxanthine-guanine phosphoribosyltransferase